MGRNFEILIDWQDWNYFWEYRGAGFNQRCWDEVHWRWFIGRLIYEFKNLSRGDRRKCVKWSASEWNIGNFGRMKEGWDFAINSILDGADLGDEKNLKKSYRVWFLASVLVKSRSEEWMSSFVTIHCCHRVGLVTESSVEVHTPWLIDESVCETTSTTVADAVTFTPCGLPLPLKSMTFTFCSDRLIGKPLHDRIWCTMSWSLERCLLRKFNNKKFSFYRIRVR